MTLEEHTSQEQPPPVERVYMLYSGRVLSDKKEYQRWLLVEGLPNQGEEFPKQARWDPRPRIALTQTWDKLDKYAFIGEIKSFIVKKRGEDGALTLSMANVERAGRWNNEEDIRLWKAQDLATGQEILARRKLKDEDILAELNGIKEVYDRLNNLQRAQLLAKIVKYIVG